jgi:DNA-binding NtrC family response regulator
MSDNDATLLQILTDQIVAGRMPVEEARDIVIRREHFKREAVKNHGAIAALPLIKQAEREAIVEALQHNYWNRGKAAKELGINRKTLHYKMAEYQIGASAT